MPRLARITVFPIKSFDGVDLSEAQLVENGALYGDRRYALHDAQGRVVNGKLRDDVHRIRATFAADLSRVHLSRAGMEDGAFQLPRDLEPLAAWCSRCFGEPLRIVENARGGFPDDTLAAGPTVVSTATLQEVSTWFDGSDIDEIRNRFRANLVVDDAPPFWEDRLASASGDGVRFTVGGATYEGANPCQRCIVPTRSSRSGAPTSAFARTFAERRRETLPPWAAVERFDHYYRLTTNTRLAPVNSGDRVAVGDPVAVVERPTDPIGADR